MLLYDIKSKQLRSADYKVVAVHTYIFRLVKYR